MVPVPAQPQPPIDTVPAPLMPDGTPKKKNYLPWILGILVLVIAISVLTFYQITKGNNKTQPFSGSTQPPAPQEQNTIDATNIDMSSWKTYINSRDKYTIEYPPIWTITENNFSTSWFLQKTQVLSIKIPNNYDESLERGDLFEKIAIEIESNSINKALSKEWKQLISHSDYELIFKDNRFVISSTGRTPYIFEFSNPLDRNIQDQILSTFKFIDAQSKLPEVPVYPQAKFTKKIFIPPCPGEQAVCGVDSYTWKSAGNIDEVINWYEQDKSKSGWKLTGGAGLEGTNRYGSFSNGKVRYWLTIYLLDPEGSVGIELRGP